MVLLGVVLAAFAAVTSAICVRTFANSRQAKGLWGLAALLAPLATIPAHFSAVPIPAALAAGGLVAVAVVDAAEGRIPTMVAHGTTVVSLAALTGHAAATGDWETAGLALAFTAALVFLLGLLWIAGQMGFGDVRLGAALVTAMATGFAGLMVVVYVAFLTSGAAALIHRRRHGKGGHIAFGPGLVLGWAVATAVT